MVSLMCIDFVSSNPERVLSWPQQRLSKGKLWWTMGSQRKVTQCRHELRLGQQTQRRVRVSKGQVLCSSNESITTRGEGALVLGIGACMHCLVQSWTCQRDHHSTDVFMFSTQDSSTDSTGSIVMPICIVYNSIQRLFILQGAFICNAYICHTQ